MLPDKKNDHACYDVLFYSTTSRVSYYSSVYSKFIKNAHAKWQTRLKAVLARAKSLPHKLEPLGHFNESTPITAIVLIDTLPLSCDPVV